MLWLLGMLRGLQGKAATRWRWGFNRDTSFRVKILLPLVVPRGKQPRAQKPLLWGGMPGKVVRVVIRLLLEGMLGIYHKINKPWQLETKLVIHTKEDQQSQ